MTPAASPPAIDVAIVNWNTAAAALAAARAFLASQGVEVSVTIVDNASEAVQREELSEGCPEGARLLLLEQNRGYGSAVNLALAEGEAELVCASNADVIPEPGALAALAEAAFGVEDSGMVGPVFGSPADRYHSRLPGALTILAGIPVGALGRRPAPPPPAGEVREVEQPSGACFVMRRRAWRRMGGFDEGFFLWYEDVDLARRLLDAGHRNLVSGSARVGHAGARSFAQRDDRALQAIRLASVERYIGKHHRRLAPVAAPLLSGARRLRARGARAERS